jgi:hypothetical protein
VTSWEAYKKGPYISIEELITSLHGITLIQFQNIKLNYDNNHWQSIDVELFKILLSSCKSVSYKHEQSHLIYFTLCILLCKLAARVQALWSCSTPYCHLILLITYNIMSNFFFNSFFILVQYIILKLNVSSHPPVYEKETKIFVWNCAHHSSSGVVFDNCACAHRKLHMSSQWREALSLPQCRPWRFGGR